MKKLFYFSLISLLFLACSKENILKENTLANEDMLAKVEQIRIKDSLLLMESNVCLSRSLSDRTKDSLKKIILEDLKSIKESKSVTSFESPEYFDVTQKIHLKIFAQTTSYVQHYPFLEVPVPSDWVVVGGGASTIKANGSEAKAYLTESRPSLSLTSWIGSSKDHIVPEQHLICVYAIGMKMNGITPAYLRSKIHVRTKVSIKANQPSDTIKIPSNCLRLGGGATVNWDRNGYGNLLCISIPWGDNRTWMVKSKDHRYQSPCTITSYIIGIENINFPNNIGLLSVDTTYQSTAVYSSYAFISTLVKPNYALTCPGGKAEWIPTYYGRMLTQMYPLYDNISEQEAAITSLDCYYTSPGTTTAYGIGIRAMN
jgi:hypothetical protein